MQGKGLLFYGEIGLTCSKLLGGLQQRCMKEKRREETWLMNKLISVKKRKKTENSKYFLFPFSAWKNTWISSFHLHFFRCRSEGSGSPSSLLFVLNSGEKKWIMFFRKKNPASPSFFSSIVKRGKNNPKNSWANEEEKKRASQASSLGKRNNSRLKAGAAASL